MKLFSLSEFYRKATAAFKRFPLTLSWAIIGAALLIYWIEVDHDRFFENHYRELFVYLLGISWFIGCQFYIEQFKAYKKLWWIKLGVAALVLSFYFILPAKAAETSDPKPFIKYGIFLLGGHISLLFAPFITVWHPKAYWNYLSDSLVALARSLLFSGILFLGLVLALLAIAFLFGVDISEKRYLMLFVMCLGIVHTWVYLSDFPEEIQHNIHMHFHKVSAVFVKFILIPLALLYILILYAYTLKIIIQWELPKGWVSYLVTALAGLLLAIQFIIHPVRRTHPSTLIRKFQPLSYWLFLPLLPLLYVAIYTRVNAYGITVSRYYLVLLALFITTSILYVLFSRKQQLRFLPIAFCFLLLAGSFGFWGAFSISIQSQKQELKSMYSAFAKADNNNTPEGSTTLSDAEATRFRNIIKYLYDRNATEEIQQVIGYDPIPKGDKSSYWRIANTIFEEEGITVLAPTTTITNRSFLSTYDTPLPIDSYDWLRAIYLNSEDQNCKDSQMLLGYCFSLDAAQPAILIQKEQAQVMTLDFSHIKEKLLQRPVLDGSNIPLETLMIRGENDSIRVKIYITELYINFADQDRETINAKIQVLISEPND